MTPMLRYGWVLCLRRCFACAHSHELHEFNEFNECHESSKSAENTRILLWSNRPHTSGKSTGFNHRGHGEHRVFKSILRVPLCPLWLYFLPMLFRSVALLCIQLTITKTLGFLDIARIMQNPRSQNPYMPSPRRVNRTWVGG